MIDTDGDGQISRDEFRAAFNGAGTGLGEADDELERGGGGSDVALDDEVALAMAAAAGFMQAASNPGSRVNSRPSSRPRTPPGQSRSPPRSPRHSTWRRRTRPAIHRLLLLPFVDTSASAFHANPRFWKCRGSARHRGSRPPRAA